MEPRTVRTLGFLGAGVMGAPMVKRLLGAGFTVQVWNRTPAKLEPLLALGALRARNPAEAATSTDALLVCLSDAGAAETALFGSEGAAHSATPPPLLVDFSTIGPAATSALARRLRQKCGTHWVDAPVSGGALGAEQGKLVVFCGGEEAHIARLAPVFAALSQRFTRMGGLGTGQTLKLCNQLIVAANLAAISESLALARAAGLEITALPDAMAGGFADSLPLQVFGRRMAAGIRMPVVGELGLMLKDLNAVNVLAEETQCTLPMLSAAVKVFELAKARGMQREDLAALFSLHSSTN